MLKCRPPLTTLETRLTCTTVSSRFSFEASILGILSPSGLETQAYFTSAFCQRSHAPMIGITASIKDDLTDTFVFGALGNQFTHFTSKRYFPIVGDCIQGLDLRLFCTLHCAWKLSFDLSKWLSPFTSIAFLGLTALCLRFLCFGPFSFGWSHRGRHLYRSCFSNSLLFDSTLEGALFSGTKLRKASSNGEAATKV